MASENMIAQVRKGMEVHTADGQTLGKVAEIWLGTDPTATNPRCDEEICSRLEVTSGGVFKRSVLYVPANTIANVTANQVILSLDAAAVNDRDWVQRPRWMGEQPDTYRVFPGSR
jgi:hypothetical protein